MVLSVLLCPFTLHTVGAIFSGTSLPLRFLCPELEKCLFLLLWKVLSVPIAKDKLSQLSESNLSTKLVQCFDVELKLPPSQNIEFSYFSSVL